jgi:hypothetical protein
MESPKRFGLWVGVWIGLWSCLSIAVEPSLAKRFGYGAAVSTFIQIFLFTGSLALFLWFLKRKQN